MNYIIAIIKKALHKAYTYKFIRSYRYKTLPYSNAYSIDSEGSLRINIKYPNEDFIVKNRPFFNSDEIINDFFQSNKLAIINYETLLINPNRKPNLKNLHVVGFVKCQKGNTTPLITY
jgi:hypothetical protein